VLTVLFLLNVRRNTACGLLLRMLLTLQPCTHRCCSIVCRTLVNVQVLMRLHAKRQIMSNMVAFLKNEDEFTETIMATLHAAEDHGIDPEFIQRGEWWWWTRALCNCFWVPWKCGFASV
jgi:hypothetical protein